MPTSMSRWTGMALQAAFDTPATAPTTILNYVKTCTIEPVPTSELMKVEGGTRAMTALRIPGTLLWRVRLTVEVDSRQFPLLCVPGAGYSYATATHHLFWGDDPAAAMTLFRYSGITGEAWQVGNLLLNTVRFNRTWTEGGNGGTADLEYLGSARDVIADPGAVLSVPATHYVPFTPSQSVLLRAAAGFCPLTADLNLNNNVGARYCGPSADALTTDPIWLAPDELQAREAEGTINITAAYAGPYAGSLLEDSDTNTERAYTLKLRDPAGTPTSLLWTFPRVAAPPGGFTDTITDPEQRQTIQGDLLRDSSGRIALLDVVNDEAAYIA